LAFGPRFSMTMMTPDVLNEGSGLSAEVGTAGPVDKSARLDRIGVVASAACAVHCLVAPLLMLALPVTGAIWSHWSVHWILAVLVLPLACWVIYRGYRRHGRRLALVAAGLGSALIVAGLMILPMVDTDWGVSASLPAWMGGGLAATAGGAEGEHAACADAACCGGTGHAARQLVFDGGPWGEPVVVPLLYQAVGPGRCIERADGGLLPRVTRRRGESR